MERDRKTVLVVDDEPENRAIMVRVLQKDFDVVEAANGADALLIARTKRPDVVIADQRMPKIKGVELLAHIRKELPGAIRILATAYTDHKALMEAVNEAQIHHYFEKPVHTVDLKTVVEVLTNTDLLRAEFQEATIAFRASERLRSAMLETSWSAMLLFGPSGGIRDLNAQACELFGCTRDEALHNNLHDLFADEALDKFLGKLTDAKAPRELTLKAKSNDGQTFWAQTRATRVHDDTQELYVAAIQKTDAPPPGIFE